MANDLLGVLLIVIPKSANLPKTFAKAKQVIDKLGLSYVKIDACPHHC